MVGRGERGGKTEKKVQGEAGRRKNWGVGEEWLGKEEKEDDVGGAEGERWIGVEDLPGVGGNFGKM